MAIPLPKQDSGNNGLTGGAITPTIIDPTEKETTIIPDTSE